MKWDLTQKYNYEHFSYGNRYQSDLILILITSYTLSNTIKPNKVNIYLFFKVPLYYFFCQLFYLEVLKASNYLFTLFIVIAEPALIIHKNKEELIVGIILL